MPVWRQALAGYPTIDATPTTGSMVFAWGITGRDVSDFLYEVFPPNSATNLYATESDPLSGKYRASSVHIEPFQGDKTPVRAGGTFANSDLYDHGINSERPTYKAVVTYSSSQRTFDDDGDSSNTRDPVTMLSHSISIGGEYITLDDQAKIRWGEYSGGSYTEATTNNEPLKGQEAGFPIPTMEHSIHWHRVVSPPFQAIYDSVGCLNSVPMQFNVGTFYPQTVLFLGAEISRDVMSDGQRAWSVTYRFSIKKLDEERVATASQLNYNGNKYGGWNHFFDTETGMFRLLLKKNSSATYLGTGSLMFPMKPLYPSLFTQV